MSIVTRTFETARQLRDALPGLPESAVIKNSAGARISRLDVSILSGTYAPYTVTYEATTPAPLDPTRVKAGDTVTLERGTSTITDVVDFWYYGTGLTWYRFRYSDDGYYDVPSGVGFWTLTAHQPAPEPENKYVPDLAHIRSAYVDARHDTDLITSQEAEAEFDAWLASHVVIDPAEVDVEELEKVYGTGYTSEHPSHLPRRAGLLSVLSHLGIEAS